VLDLCVVVELFVHGWCEWCVCGVGVRVYAQILQLYPDERHSKTTTSSPPQKEKTTTKSKPDTWPQHLFPSWRAGGEVSSAEGLVRRQRSRTHAPCRGGSPSERTSSRWPAAGKLPCGDSATSSASREPRRGDGDPARQNHVLGGGGAAHACRFAAAVIAGRAGPAPRRRRLEA